MSAAAQTRIVATLAQDISAAAEQVRAAVTLLDEGATVPFIARYRKELTGGLDDTQLRLLEERLAYLREREDRRASILASIGEQGKLTPELRRLIDAAESKSELEDLYLPYKPKRRTRAQIAREAGLEPLADALLADPTLDPAATAAAYVAPDRGVADAAAALDGARQILVERMSEHPAVLADLRALLEEKGKLVATVIEGKEAEGAKFRDYFDYQEAWSVVPSHRALAILRGRNEGVLKLAIKLPEELAPEPPRPGSAERRIAVCFGLRDQGRAADRWLGECVRWAWQVKLSQHLELELVGDLRTRAEEEAIRVFAHNLKDLLLAAPAGPRATLGLDPGLRTGVKVAVIDRTGKLVDTATVYPHEPRRDWDGSIHELARLAKRHGVELVAIGNGTASRETDKLAADLMTRHPELKLAKIVVSEAGASVYSASELASREFPELDVSLRGAVSIARRLQDPLAELVKIEPKAIGVGQYQHDVSQTRLGRALDAVVEDCVNAVGVDANTASAALLKRVSGLNAGVAANIVAHRDTNGPFRSRASLREVTGLGEKTFVLSAGFLRIAGGENPLDASAVHPEAYPLAKRILGELGRSVQDLMRDPAPLAKLDPARYTDERFGLPTVQDILRELEKPGRDPRPEFRTAAFREGVENLKDLTPGMVLEGVVTNVTNFGAFVDIGVHQDGLVHISMLSERFVKDPREVVKAGDVVRVKVLEVDLERKRVALTMRLADTPAAPASGKSSASSKPATPGGGKAARRPPAPASEPARGALGDALAKALKR
ncbi:MAG: RNA-binding transcriptional accessory protein [Rhodocyclaceae bacterium]|nr:RNA-binding transcriptional accessory protein [Rhodocyclaceae bacterium]MBX3666776.1 RNA-binding transcriptional accessory protein [Rhodocyclaceae bacterium]